MNLLFHLMISWSKIAENLPGRTDNEIKNFWNYHMKKKLRKLGIGTNSKEEQSSGSTSEATDTDTKNVQQLETENGSLNFSNQYSNLQLPVETMDDDTSLRDYMNSLAKLINLDEIGSNVKDDSLHTFLYY